METGLGVYPHCQPQQEQQEYVRKFDFDNSVPHNDQTVVGLWQSNVFQAIHGKPVLGVYPHCQPQEELVALEIEDLRNSEKPVWVFTLTANHNKGGKNSVSAAGIKLLVARKMSVTAVQKEPVWMFTLTANHNKSKRGVFQRAENRGSAGLSWSLQVIVYSYLS
eukprot:1183824-Prorocentrum_minimum.AAC.2